MERTKPNKKPDAILMADIHARDDQPVARTDSYWEKQFIKLEFIQNLQNQYCCHVLNAGDTLNHWKPSHELTTELMKYLPESFYTVLGQHDLPQHNLKLAMKSGVAPLEQAESITIVGTCHFGETPHEDGSLIFEGKKVLLWHYMTYKDEKPFPQHKGPSALRILKKYPQYDLIVTGDNHKPFVQEYEGRLLVNPGSMMRITAAQIDHKPRVYLWYAETNTVTPVYLPIEEGVVSREHIDKVQERDQRIDAFITKLSGDWEAEMSFEDNLKKAINANKIPKLVQDIIYKAIES